MKNQTINIAILVVAFTVAIVSCKKKETPVPDEQELITTMKLVVTDGGSYSQTFIYKVENGFGTTTAGTMQIDTVKLEANKSYTVTAELYNEKANPVENTTDEILQEQNVHLFLYQSEPVTGAGAITFSNGSRDHNNMPFNQVITFTTGNAGTGKLQVDLMHEPTNKNGTIPAASGGETDAEAIFPIIIY